MSQCKMVTTAVPTSQASIFFVFMSLAIIILIHNCLFIYYAVLVSKDHLFYAWSQKMIRGGCKCTMTH